MHSPLERSRVFVAGHRGLAGSAVLRCLLRAGCTEVITRTHAELDLTRSPQVENFFSTEKPEYVFLCAAKVGGIAANSTRPAEFIHQNLAIQTNVIDASYRHGVKRLLFLGSSCIYPRECPQPIRESYLMTGPLEPTNRPYAVAKIAGIEMCWSYNRQYGTRFLTAMPTNLYGPNDNYDPEHSHVLPALLQRIHRAKLAGDRKVVVWGTGAVRREFLHSDDMASACLCLMSLRDQEFQALSSSTSEAPLVNVGCGEDLTIRELAELIAEIVGFRGQLVFDTTKPDGTPRKLLDISRIRALGWHPTTSLRQGLESVYLQYAAQAATAGEGGSPGLEADVIS
jgi:GDP-L-fucose synthase